MGARAYHDHFDVDLASVRRPSSPFEGGRVRRSTAIRSVLCVALLAAAAPGVASAQRSALAPEVPTISEAGEPGFSAAYWFHATVRTGTPQPIIARLREAVIKALRTPAVADSLLKGGFEPLMLSPAEAEKALKENTARWARVIRENHLRGS